MVQTFSKSRAMAGIRIGYAMGSEKLIKYLNDAKFSFNSYTMNMPSLVLGTAAVKDDAYFKMITAKIINTREWVKKKCGIWDFLFRTPAPISCLPLTGVYLPKKFFEALKAKDIYVRHWNKPRIDNYLRISIGTDEEMKALLAFLTEYLGDK